MLGFTKFKINRLVNRRELYSNFSYNKWNQLDTGSKWKCLQQLENHFAAEQGRPAVKVLPISSKEARGAYGGYDPDKNVIYINRDLVEYGTLVGPVDINHPTQLDANMQLFDTIAHEGYHAYQGYAIKHPGFHKDMKQVKEWAINDRNVKYFRRGDEYLVQPRERDAWKYGSEKTREAFDEIEKYYGTEPGRAMYEKSVEDNSYENALERLWNNNPDALNQMYKEMMDAYEERYRENNSTVNLDPITVDEYDAISREAVNRYYEHLKNNPSLSNEDVMRMTGDMSEKYFSAVEEYKNAVQQKEKSEDRGEKENRTEKYEAQNPENRSIFNPDRVSVEEYDKTLRDQVNKYYEHLKNDPSLSNEDVMRMTEEMSEKYLTAVEEYRNAQKQEDEGFQEKSGDKESTEKRYKKEEIEKENPEHKRDVENQRKEEVEEENKSEKKDKLENREDEKDYEEEGAENKDKTETLSEDELEEERWNESESEDEAELLSDKAEAGEEQNAEDKFYDVLEEVPRVRKDLGEPPLVTPSSQIVGTQAVFNVLMGERYKMVTKETKAVLSGEYGKTVKPFNKDVQKKCIGDKEPITCRPADLIPDELDTLRGEMAQWSEQDEDVLSYALFPQVATDFFKYREAQQTKVDATVADSKNGAYPV